MLPLVLRMIAYPSPDLCYVCKISTKYDPPEFLELNKSYYFESNMRKIIACCFLIIPLLGNSQDTLVYFRELTFSSNEEKSAFKHFFNNREKDYFLLLWKSKFPFHKFFLYEYLLDRQLQRQ